MSPDWLTIASIDCNNGQLLNNFIFRIVFTPILCLSTLWRHAGGFIIIQVKVSSKGLS